MWYDYELPNGLKVQNAPATGISFAGIRRGDVQTLVTSEDPLDTPPFQVAPRAELSAPFSVKDGRLRLDLSKSAKSFLPAGLQDLGIDWSTATWEKVNE